MQHLLKDKTKADCLVRSKTIDQELGSRLIVNPRDIAHAETGNYDVVLTYKDGRGLNPSYADVNYRPNHL